MKPYPILQSINLVIGIFMLAWEWPLGFIAGTALHRSMEARLAFIPFAAIAAVLTYQGTNAALYYLVAMVVEFWAYAEGEVCCYLHQSFHLSGTAMLTGLCRSSVPSLGHYHKGTIAGLPDESTHWTLPSLRHFEVGSLPRPLNLDLEHP